MLIPSRRLLLIFIILWLSSTALFAQSNPVSVPDVRGLNAPQAAAALNQAGLRLGAETDISWSADATVPANTIGIQTPEAGQSVERGSAVDITVLRDFNALLIYDDNDVTFVNQTGVPLDMNTITFSSVEGNPSVFAGSRWFYQLDANDCGQLWSVQRSAPKEQPECTGSIYWLALVNDRSVHFWTTTNGVAKFAVLQSGVQRAVCDAAPPGTQDAPYRCPLYLPVASEGDVTPYLYFAYTTDGLVIRNRSEDAWMPLAGLTISSTQGTTEVITDLAASGSPDPIYDLSRLAPNQCLSFAASAGAAAPEACNVIAQAVPAAPFWLNDFSFVSVTDGQQRTCPAATADKRTVCILPR